MSDHLLEHGTRGRETSQLEPIRADQIANSEGGYVWQLDEWARLRRFLILGTKYGSAYASSKDLTGENLRSLQECISADGIRTVNEIVDVSDSGRAPKNDGCLYALAACISLGDKPTKRAAAEALPKVARIGTHLYDFVAYAESMRGWGRTMRWAVSNWYDRNPDQLALQAVKYRQRNGWSHRDLLRLAHPVAKAELAPLFDWITHGHLADRTVVRDEPKPGSPIVFETVIDPYPLIRGFTLAQHSSSPKETAKIVRDYGLPREALQTEHLNSPEVWRALLDVGMPMTAMLRNLATMTRHEVLIGEYLGMVTSALTNVEALRKARVHPMAILIAQRTYAQGHGHRGGNTWQPAHTVIDALDEAFYLAFDNVETTGKQIVLGIDVSGSMDASGVGDSPLTAREAAVAMALVTLHAEPNCEVIGFTSRVYPLSISKRQRLDDALRATPQTGEGTDCAIPIREMVRQQARRDAVVLYTDNETWGGAAHVDEVLRKYRQMAGPARLVACGMVANKFTVCDPTDVLSLNVAGFDASTPSLISQFAAAQI